MKEMKSLINAKAGETVAYDLREENPTEVTGWISTGSSWLDGIVARGMMAGLPLGKIVEIAGAESTGKSYLAVQAAFDAQSQDIDVIYFDSESAISPDFLANAGLDMSKLMYVQAKSIEFVLETIEDLLASNDNKMLFIWDSLAMTPCESDIEGDFDPLSSVAVAPRILSKGFKKLTLPIANAESTLLIVNQLKTVIGVTNPKYAPMTDKYFAPGGKACAFAYSLRIWLTGSKSQSSYIKDDKGFRIGSNVKATLVKSRFGSEGRHCEFKILWGDPEKIGVQDEESLLKAIENSERVEVAAKPTTTSKVKVVDKNGGVHEVKYGKFSETMRTDKKFKDIVMEIFHEEVVQKFDERKESAEHFYDTDEDKPDEQ